MIDRTILNIASLVLAGAGLLTVLTKFNVPELNMLFIGANPFVIKRDIIESTMTWLFTGLALVGLLLQLFAEIFGEDLHSRLYAGRTYIAITLVILIASFILVYGLTFVGNRIAKWQWLPKVISSQAAVYAKTRFILDHEGLTEVELSNTNLPNIEQRRHMNLHEADDTIALLERLLEVSNREGSSRERLARLGKYFDAERTTP